MRACPFPLLVCRSSIGPFFLRSRRFGASQSNNICVWATNRESSINGAPVSAPIDLPNLPIGASFKPDRSPLSGPQGRPRPSTAITFRKISYAIQFRHGQPAVLRARAEVGPAVFFRTTIACACLRPRISGRTAGPGAAQAGGLAGPAEPVTHRSKALSLGMSFLGFLAATMRDPIRTVARTPPLRPALVCQVARAFKQFQAGNRIARFGF
jgi:hypothetical protein